MSLTVGRRSPHSSSSRSSSRNRQKASAELVTYRYGDEMVYVTPGSNFDEALSHAQTVFPQLAHVSKDRIAFSVNVKVGSEQRTVRIAPMAWSRVISTLSTYEIIDIALLPHSQVSRAAKSDTDVHFAGVLHEDGVEHSVYSSDSQPPSYGYAGQSNLSVRTDSDQLLGADLRDRCEPKSPNSASSSPPSSPINRRCASALGWIGRHL